MARPLAAAGFDVHEAATGRNALRLASPDGRDCAGPRLARHGRFEVLRRLKADEATVKIPVILKTAVHVEDGHRQRGLDAGGAAYFAEPFDPQSIVAVVRRVLGDGAASGSPSKP